MKRELGEDPRGLALSTWETLGLRPSINKITLKSWSLSPRVTGSLSQCHLVSLSICNRTPSLGDLNTTHSPFEGWKVQGQGRFRAWRLLSSYA